MSCELTNTLTPQNSPLGARRRIAPAIGDEIQALMAQGALLNQLVQALGSPLNIVFPERVAANVQSFFETFEHYGVEGRVYFTTKPNRSTSIIREVACESELGVDVSSEGALAASLAAGVSPSRIEATGPKDQGYLALALLQRVILNVDDLNEIDTIYRLKKLLGIKGTTQILVRLSGFKSPHTAFVVSDGTFGVTPELISELWPKLRMYKNEISLLGFSYHLNTSSLEYRVVALEQTLSLLFEAKRQGFSPRVVNIGGGFRIRYANNSTEWEDFLTALKSSMTNQSEPCTWNRSGLGFYLDHGKVTGSPRFMDHAEQLPPADQLCALLKHELPAFGGISAGRLLSESLVELWVEPGRALLDQVGLTVGIVTNVRTSEQGHPLIVMKMNRSNLNAFELTLLTDPLLIPKDSASPASELGYFLTGNLCVANELLTPRKICFGTTVSPGDLLVFANTAPYIMDFAESPTLHHPVARKVAAWLDGEDLKWCLDEEYRPFLKDKS